MRTLMISLMALALGGCSSSGTRTVSGQLDLTQMRLSNAQVVAISSTGRVFRAPIATSGAFNIALPTHASYTLRFANATNAAGRYDAFATLTPHRPSGATHWFTMTSGAAIDLGLVSRAGTTAPRAAGGLSTASDGTGSDSGADSSGMTSGEQEDDGAEACDLSGGSDDADVESQNDVNDSVDSDHDGTPDSADDQNDATCSAAGSTGSGDDCEVSDSEGKDLDESADQPCSGGGIGAGSTPVTPAPGLI